MSMELMGVYKKYGVKPGLTVYLDGKKVAHSDTYATRMVL